MVGPLLAALSVPGVVERMGWDLAWACISLAGRGLRGYGVCAAILATSTMSFSWSGTS